MSMGVGGSGLVVKANRRFLNDAAKLPYPLPRKVGDVIGILREHGAYYPRLETRKIKGNSDDRFRLMDVDDSYRIVAVLEGKFVFLEKVGAHDPTERWGEKASLREYEERIAVTPASVDRKRQAPAATEEFLELGPSLPEIAASEAISEVLADCVDGVLEGWVDGTIEDWMVFLSPVQRRAVDRSVGGPARVTGGPGTGKTVVALHRAANFARALDPGRKVLMTSFVRTVPEVLEGLVERLAPDQVERCEFATVHSLAMRHLDRATAPRPDAPAARRRFGNALRGDTGRYQTLRYRARFTDDYLFDEVTRVIEGRGIETLEQYQKLARHGRRRQMPASVRASAWDVYEAYREACDTGPEPVADWDWILKLALEHVREHPVAEKYAAIIVDEAQDITEVGVRFLLELLEDGPKGLLLLVGDSGQRIYTGGYRLSELGLEVRGRSFPMSVCYRSTDEIMQAVGALGRFVSTEEFGEDGLRSLSMSTVRSGPRPVLKEFGRVDDEVAWLLGLLDPDDPALDGTAILVPSNREVDRWRELVLEAGVGVVRLDEYHGRPVPGVKIGTYNRAKGLEFHSAFLPSLDASFPFGDRNDLDEIVRSASRLYVAMSRARDRLYLSYAGSPSLFLEPVVDYCDTEMAG